MRTRYFIPVLAFLAFGQEPGFKITVNTNLVIVNVDVRDRSGKPFEGLSASSFTITEDGKPQKISVFEYQRLESEVQPEPVAVPAATGTAPKRQITPSPPGQIRYRDRRLLVLFFDFSSMPAVDQVRAQESALEFIDRQMNPADLVSIMAFSNQLKVLEDFTSDRDRLRRAIQSFRIGEGSELAVEGAVEGDENAEDTGDAFTADETEFNIFNTDRKLGALESAAKMLASLPEKKALVYFSSGVGKTGMENQSQLKATVNAAVRANVAFYPVDARGLTASAPAGDAANASPTGSSIFSGQRQRSVREKFNDQQETLFTLAGDTGGKALLDSNDLTAGIRQAQRDIASYYILGYYPTNPAQDGRFRRIKVALSASLQAKLDYRGGYFAPKEFKAFDASDKERQLEEALLLGDPLTDLPIALEVNYFRVGRDRYFVPLAVKIPGSAIELARSGSSGQAELDFIGQVRNAGGHLTASVRDMIRVRLSDEKAGKLGQRNIGYDSGFTLEPGHYALRFLARENVTGKMGTFETKFTVPNLMEESRRLRTSSVVWANQRESLTAAVGAAERNRRVLAMHPLIEGGQKLIPSITRVFRKDQTLYVYVEVYDAGAPQNSRAPSISANLSLFHGAVKVFESDPVSVSTFLPARPSVAAVKMQIPLFGLQSGHYTSQLSLIDEFGQKFTFVRSPLVLLDPS